MKGPSYNGTTDLCNSLFSMACAPHELFAAALSKVQLKSTVEEHLWAVIVACRSDVQSCD